MIFSDDPGGREGVVLFKAHSANQYEIIDNGDGTFSSTPGVGVTLVRNEGPPVTFTLIGQSQNSYTFDEDGTLLTWADPQGHTRTYTYDGNGRLDLITDDTSGRYLDIGYDTNDRIETVTDHTGRSITFGYDAAGDLTSVNDVMGEDWTYEYDDHRLTYVRDPRLVTVVHTVYDLEGRAEEQYYESDGIEILLVEITYNPDGTATLRDALGNTQTHTYDERNTLLEDADDSGNGIIKDYDYNFRPSAITDRRNETTYLSWGADGANLESIIDAGENPVSLYYDDLNNLTQIVDARGYPTDFVYTGTLLDEMIDAYGENTLYTYTTTADAPQPEGLLKTVEDRNGNLTEYEYDEEGNLITVTQYDGGVPIETEYGYDELGRQVTVEDSLGVVNWTCYDSAGQVVRSVANASGDGALPQTDPCDAVNYIPVIDPDQDRISSFVYDEVGNAIASINPAGVITRTYYDDSNRPELVVQNLTGKLIEDEVPPVCLPSNTEINLCTKYDYDENGNTIATTDHLGHITRTYYDALNRPELVVQNLTNHDPLSSTPPVCISSNNESNLCTKYDYDENGNSIAVTDHLGHITRTYYDALNRPEVVVQNLTSQGILIETPPYCDPGSTLEDLCTEYYYDENGNTIATVNVQGTITRTYYDALNRPEVVVQNLTGQGILIETPPVCVHTSTTENLCTEYYYDKEGNTIATVDPAGVTTRTYYDDLNRPEKVVQNLTGSIYEAPPDYNSAYPDQNVDTEYVYDNSGNRIATIDVLGHITRTYYDDLGRTRFVVRNLDPGYGISNETPPAYSPSNPDQNVRTETVYDSDGTSIASIDTLGRITRTYYDDLGRRVFVVRNLDPAYGIYTENPPVYNPSDPDENVLTEYVYDGLGNLIETTDPNGQVSYSCLDGLNRVVRSVQNPSVSDPCGSYTHNPDPDRDIITETLFDGLGNALTATDANGIDVDFEYNELNRLLSETIDPDGLNLATSYSYDGLGNRTWRTDAEGVKTKFEYDVFGRLTAVVENFDILFPPTHDMNVRTDYVYDKVGNRVSIEDGKDQITEFSYDDLNRLISESADPYGLNLTTSYGYDGVGNRTSVTDAEEHTMDYDYDDLNRLIEVDYNDLEDTNVTFTYDGLGNRLTMVDGAGTTIWNYDELNRPLFVNDPFGDDVGYTYDAGGNRLSLTYPGLGSVSYQYDALGRMEEVEDWDNLQNTVYTYDDGGRLKTASLPNGVTSTYDYDNANNLLTIEHAIGLEVLSSFEYTYDNVGNRTSVIEYLAPMTTATPTPSPTPTETEIPTEVLIGEVGQVSDLTDTPQTVNLSQSYTDPVIFAQPVSFNSDDTSVVRITDVQADRFTMYVHEAPDMDGAHPQETVSYLVLEAGVWQLADGTLLEVGKVSTTSAVVYPTWDDWEEIVLSAGFSAAPAVLSQVQSENDPDWVKTRQMDVSASSFYVSREYWETYPYEPSGSEVIGWLAIEVGEGDWSGHAYEAGITPNVVEENWYEIVFSASFNSAPRFLASLATYLDPDPAALRYTALDQMSVDVFVEEDTTDRPEVNHDPEGVSYLALEGDGTLEAIDIGGGEFLLGVMGDSATSTPTGTPTPSVSPGPSLTATTTQTITFSPTPTPIPSASTTPSSTPTADATPTPFDPATPSSTSTSTATSTPTTDPSPIAYDDAQQDGYPVSYLADSRQASLLGGSSIRTVFEPLFSFIEAEVPVADTRDQDPMAVVGSVGGNAGMAGREDRREMAVLEIFEALYYLLMDRLGGGKLSAVVGQSFPADADPLYEGSVNASGKPTASNTPTATNTFTPTYTPTNTSTPTDTPTPSPNFEVTYVYDDLYRLTAADYVDGTFFHYTYDAVGNRLTQDSLAGMITYDYDDANRLTSVDGVTYSWDDNGNLLSDGVSTYTYTYDNMLASVNKGGVVYEYLYSGLGDRLGQTVDGVPTLYTLDIVSGLTQVLSDGTNAYLYGRGRIGEEGAGGWQYPLGDALSSVRQLTDSEGYVGLVKAYEPYGSVLSSTGDAVTNYGFTGEWTDDYIKLLFLRSRFYSYDTGRFITKDIWMGSTNRPLSLNGWSYVEGNPINQIDPTGLFPCDNCMYMRSDALQSWCIANCCGERSPIWSWRVKGYQLDNWEVTLLALTVQAETQNGTWSKSIMENIAWVFLNRLSLLPQAYPTMWDAVNGVNNNQSAVVCYHSRNMGGISCYNDEEDIYKLKGDPLDPAVQKMWTVKVMVEVQGGIYGDNFSYRVLPVTNEVYRMWLLYGSRSFVDPTGGATDFSIATPSQRYSGKWDIPNNELTQEWRAYWWRWYRSYWQEQQRFGFNERASYFFKYVGFQLPQDPGYSGARFLLLSNKSYFTPYIK